MQVYTPPPSGSDPLANMQLPIMGVAVVVLLGYQFTKQKGKGSSGGGGSEFNNADFANFASKRKGGLRSKGLAKMR